MLREKQQGGSALHMTNVGEVVYRPAVLVILKDGVAHLFTCHRETLVE